MSLLALPRVLAALSRYSPEQRAQLALWLLPMVGGDVGANLLPAPVEKTLQKRALGLDAEIIHAKAIRPSEHHDAPQEPR